MPDHQALGLIVALEGVRLDCNTVRVTPPDRDIDRAVVEVEVENFGMNYAAARCELDRERLRLRAPPANQELSASSAPAPPLYGERIRHLFSKASVSIEICPRWEHRAMAVLRPGLRSHEESALTIRAVVFGQRELLGARPVVYLSCLDSTSLRGESLDGSAGPPIDVAQHLGAASCIVVLLKG